MTTTKGIFTPPSSDISSNVQQKFAVWKKVLTSLLAVLPAAVYLLAYNVLPQFMQTFSSFGSPLPKETLLVIELRPALPVLSLLSLSPAFIWWCRKSKMQFWIFIFSLGNATLGILAYYFFTWALYAPIAATAIEN